MGTERIYDLEQRTLIFARDIRHFIKRLRMDIATLEDARQLIRSSGSIGANYIEANESLGKKDFLMRIKICRKEAKESVYWLSLIESGNSEEIRTIQCRLRTEAGELMKIFGAILRKCSP